MENQFQNNNLQELEQVFDELWGDCESDLYQHWLDLAQNLNQQLFEGKNDAVVDVAEVIADFREVFDHMSSNVDSRKRRSYCKALLNYCELTQDWRDWENWIQAEIQNGVGNDGAWLYCGLGRYLEETGRLKESLKYHKKGIQASQEIGSKTFLAFNYLGVGITLQRSQEYEQAEWYLKESLAIFQSENDYYQQANTLANLGSCYDRCGKGKEAIACYQEAVSILESLNNRFDLGRILYSLGIAYLRVNEIGKAEATFLEAEDCCESTGNSYFLALTLYGIGWLEYRKGSYEISRQRLEDAIKNLQEASESELAATQLAFPEIEGNIYLVAGAAYSKGSNPNFEVANKYLDLAEISYRKLDYADDKLNNVLANRARVYEYSRRWDVAISAFSELLNKGKERSSRNTIADAAVHLFRIYKKKSASVLEWMELVQKLGILGMIALAQGLFNQVKRDFTLSRYHRQKNN